MFYSFASHLGLAFAFSLCAANKFTLPQRPPGSHPLFSRVPNNHLQILHNYVTQQSYRRQSYLRFYSCRIEQKNETQSGSEFGIVLLQSLELEDIGRHPVGLFNEPPRGWLWLSRLIAKNRSFPTTSGEFLYSLATRCEIVSRPNYQGLFLLYCFTRSTFIVLTCVTPCLISAPSWVYLPCRLFLTTTSYLEYQQHTATIRAAVVSRWRKEADKDCNFAAF